MSATRRQTIEKLREREARLVAILADPKISKEAKRHTKRALVRVRSAIRDREASIINEEKTT